MYQFRIHHFERGLAICACGWMSVSLCNQAKTKQNKTKKRNDMREKWSVQKAGLLMSCKVAAACRPWRIADSATQKERWTVKFRKRKGAGFSSCFISLGTSHLTWENHEEKALLTFALSSPFPPLTNPLDCSSVIWPSLLPTGSMFGSIIQRYKLVVLSFELKQTGATKEMSHTSL